MDYDNYLEIAYEMSYRQNDAMERSEALQDDHRDLMMFQGEENA